MLIKTHHGTFLARASDGSLFQVDRADQALAATSVANAEHALGMATEVGGGGRFSVRSEGKYVTALPDGTVSLDRDSASLWELFTIAEFDGSDVNGGDARRFADRIEELSQAGLPIKLHLACGLFPIPGFLNVDYVCAAPEYMRRNPEEYFIIPTVGVRVPVADDVVDFIFHENFLEHIDQLSQIQFLAEMRRIMKPGGVHRVNTPNLICAMKTHSDFSKGFEGVYTGERQWEHISIYSPSHLEEIARMVGYRAVAFLARGKSMSQYAIVDRRPFGDRDEIEGNIFADLIK